MESKPFKVIIAGGSVAGLSLALMLERNGIDFVILEGYSSIAPQVGASIGMLPNGLRILDQLGCCDDMLKRADVHVSDLFFRDSRGQPFWSFKGFGGQMKKQWVLIYHTHVLVMGILGFVLRLFFGRHGYPIVFLERRILVQTLYDHIQDKSKVLTSEKVVTVKNSISHVTVTTSTGKSFTGDMVAGADGINSTIRQKMWEESQSIDPTWVDPSEIECMYTSDFLRCSGLIRCWSRPRYILMFVRHIRYSAWHWETFPERGVQRQILLPGWQRSQQVILDAF